MPAAVPVTLSSRRHLAAAAVGLGVVAVLTTAATFAPAPAAVSAAEPVAATTTLTTGRASSAPRETTVAVGATASDAPTSAAPVPDGPAITALAEQGIPIVALQAYQRSAALQADERPSCHLAWTLVAAIGAVESGHGTHAGARLYADGQDLPHVIGPALDGTNGNAVIADTDKGAWDGDPVYDHAVGPMQFIPSTWTARGIDANGDGVADPFNIVDAAATTGDYLCRYGTDLGTDAGRKVAVFGYNHLDSYVATVLALDAAYAGRPVVTTSTSPAAAPAPTTAAPVSSSAVPTAAAPTPAAPAPTTPVPASPTPTPTCPTGAPIGTPTATPTPLPSGCPTPTATTSATTAATTAATGSPAASATPTLATPTPGPR